jgi:hypothetical protein
MTTPSNQFDRSLEQITTHLRAHVAELRWLEQTGATAREVEERRELVARLQGHLAGLVRTALAPPEPAEPTSNDGPSPQRHAPHSRSRSRTALAQDGSDAKPSHPRWRGQQRARISEPERTADSQRPAAAQRLGAGWAHRA